MDRVIGDGLGRLTRRTALGLLSAFATACGSNSSGSNGIDVTNDGCKLGFMGTYVFTYTTVSGNCGDLSPVQTMTGGDPSSNLSTACMGGTGMVTEVPPDAGGCAVSTKLTGCQIPQGGGTFDLTESVTWNAGYTMGSGTVTFDIPGNCSGTYDITGTRQ